jgi:cell wall assembly regulator SMI1
MITIELTQNNFKINDIELQFPIEVNALNAILGKSRLTVKEKNNIFTWDEIGITGYTKNLETINSLFVGYKKEDYDFSPKNTFEGQILFDNQEIISFRNKHPNQVIKLFKDDDSGALLLNGIRCWFEMEKSLVEGIEIMPFDGKFYENPIKKERTTPIIIEDEFSYLIDLWEEWKNAVTCIVPVGNKFYNLKYGITDEESKMYKTLENDIEIPDELIAFYKIYNVDSNFVTSAFTISPSDWDFDLLPFNQIKAEWDNIQNLQFEDEIADTNLEKFDTKIKSNDYANPRWIPFADGRNGDYLLYDTDPSELGTYGQIVELQNESWERNVVATSLKELIENEINNLKKGKTEKYDFILEKGDSDTNEIDEVEIDEDDADMQKFFDNEIKKDLQNDLMKGLYSTKDLLEKHLDQDDLDQDEADYKALKKIAKTVIKSDKKELAKQLEKGEFQDFSKLQNVLKILETKHNIISTYVIQYTQDEAIYEAEYELNEKNAKGFVYFTEQDIERVIEEKYNFALGFNCSQRNNDPDYVRGIAIGKTIVNELEKQGFEVEWDGTINTRIFIKNFLWRCLDYYNEPTDNEIVAKHEPKKEEFFYNLLDTSAIQLVPFDAVKHFISEDSWIIKKQETGDYQYQNVLFIDGDWSIENIDLANPFNGINDNDNQIKLYNETASFFIINGNLKAKNIYSSNDDGTFGLIVTGSAEAENMVVGGSDIIIRKDLKIRDLFWGHYNHGSLTVDGIVSARVFISSDEYCFDYIPRKMEVEMYLEDPELEEDKEKMVKLADTMFAFHLLEFDIYDIYEEDFEDINSWTDIVNRDKVINVLKFANPHQTLVLKSEFTESTNFIEEEEDIIPKLFHDTTFKNKESFDLQHANFEQLMSYFRNQENRTFNFKIPEINADILITRADDNKVTLSDGTKEKLQDIIIVTITKSNAYFSAGDEFMIWKQKEETGFKTLFKKPKYDYTNKDGKSMFVFLLRDPDKTVYKYRIAFEMCKVEALQKIWDLVLETIEKGVYFKNKFESDVKNAAISSLLQLPMILEKYPNSWSDSNQCPWFGNTCYSFCQGSSDLIPTISIIKEIDNINNDFDAKTFFFRFNGNGLNATLGYLANYHELNDPVYEMRYSKISEKVPFYHYPLYQEAVKLWKKALVVLPNENEKYLAKQKLGIREIQIRENYQRYQTLRKS